MNAKSRAFALGNLLAVLAAAGCSSVFDGYTQAQRDAVVVRTMQYAELPVHVNARCVKPPSSGDPGAVTVVRYRIHRTPYWQAFTAESTPVLHTGDRVVVDPRVCSIQLKAGRSSAASDNSANGFVRLPTAL